MKIAAPDYRPITMNAWRLVRLALGLLLASVLGTPGWADTPLPRRLLHVSLYPFIPEAPAAALALKQGFEREHPEILVTITFNRNYYSLDPGRGGVLYEDADVHEIDVVLLGDFLERHKLAPLPATLRNQLTGFTPLATAAATRDGALVAAPHWMCSDFLIYRADPAKPGMQPQITSLDALERWLGPERGLLMDMKGSGTLGELYLSALLADARSPEAAVAEIGDRPDPAILDRLRRYLALEPPGYGRNARYDERESFYARQFARRAGRAFLGYSEMTHEVLDEARASCRDEDRCVGADQIGVAAFPFRDGKVRPAVWVDMFGIDSHVRGAALADAAAFIRYAVSLPAYRALLIPEPGDVPRYLLPATEAAFEDPEIRRAAPLYPAFRAILDQGAVVTSPHLHAALHAVATAIDADLPATH